MTPRQQTYGYWWATIIPNAVARLDARIPDIDTLKSYLSKAGLNVEKVDIPPETIFNHKRYLDPKGPFSRDYRDTDSTWALATPEELKEGLSWWQVMINEGKADEFLADMENMRKVVGQSSS